MYTVYVFLVFFFKPVCINGSKGFIVGFTGFAGVLIEQ